MRPYAACNVKSNDWRTSGCISRSVIVKRGLCDRAPLRGQMASQPSSMRMAHPNSGRIFTSARHGIRGLEDNLKSPPEGTPPHAETLDIPISGDKRGSGSQLFTDV